MDLKAEIEQHLAPLIGLKWSIARQAADMAVFHFGTIRPHHSGTGTVGDYALHIQGPWRIETDTLLYVGSKDIWNWKFGKEPFDWDYDMGGDLRTALLEKLLEGYDPDTRSAINTTDLLVVERVEGSIYGDATIYLTGGYRLVLFPTSRFSEAWRFFKADSDESHLVVGDEDDIERGFDPITAQDYLERARQLDRAEEYDRALADFNEAIRLEPDNSDAYYQRGYFYHMSQEDCDKAIADYTEAIRLDPTNFSYYFARGGLYQFYCTDANNEAIADYSALIALESGYDHAWEMRGYVYEEIGNDEAAMSDYNMAIQLNPTVGAYLDRARLRRHLDDYAGALADCDAALLLKPDSYIVYNEKGKVFDAMGDLSGAVREYSTLITLFRRKIRKDDTGSAEYWNLRAWAYYRMGEYESALVDAKQAVLRDNTAWEYLHTRGAIYAATNQVARAVGDYQAALDLEPDVEQDKQDMIAYIARWVRQEP